MKLAVLARLSLSLSLSLSETALSAPQIPVLSEQKAVYGPSIARSFTTTSGGEWLYLSEGATLVFFDLTGDAQASFDQMDGAKRVPLGMKGLMPDVMLLDPEANAIPTLPVGGGLHHDLLYIASGRDGLWVMEAFVGDGPPLYEENFAWRIDDSGNQDPAEQESRRWCGDVNTVRVAGKDYLLALFAKKSGSRLRVYDLDQVRAVAQRDSSGARVWSETGHELGNVGGVGGMVRQVNLTDNPNEPSPPPPLDLVYRFGRSLALAMSVDPVDTTPGSEKADVYVAMGHHGLVRVAFPGDPASVAPVVTWGPIFGGGTPYANGTVPGLPFSPALYDHAAYWHDREYAATPELTRFERPMMVDVAVHHDGDDHDLYVAADHLFWFRIDLDQPFDGDTPIEHHHGYEEAYTLTFHPGTSVPVVSSVDDNPRASAARAVEVATGPDGKDYLVVTTGGHPYVNDYARLTGEGHAYDYEFAYSGGWGAIPGDGRKIYVYELASDPSGIALKKSFNAGGNALHVPEVQSLTDILEVFHGQVTPNPGIPPPSDFGAGVCRARVSLTDPNVDPTYASRGGLQSVGSFCLQMAISTANPNLLLPGANDGGVRQPGFVVTKHDGSTGQWLAKAHTGPIQYENRGDIRGPNGFIIDSVSQWIEGGLNLVLCGGHDPVAHGVGDPLEFYGNARAQLLELSVPTDVWVDPPDRSRNAYFAAHPDTFSNHGRESYRGGFRGAYPVEDLFFIKRTGSAEGLVVFLKGDGMLKLQAPPNDNESYITNIFNSNDRKDIVTHQELNRVLREFDPVVDPDKDYQQMWKGNSLAHMSPFYSWVPKVVEVNPENGSGLGAYVLVVPCGSVRADPEWRVFDAQHHPEWIYPQGTIWRDNVSHGQVQFFPITDASGRYWPETTDKDQADAVSPLSALIGPRDKGMIWKVVPLTLPTGQVLLFSVDFGAGAVWVHEIHDILSRRDNESQIDDLLFAEWQAPLCFSDDLRETVWDVAIDYPGTGTKANVYVSVRRGGVQVLEFDAAQPYENRLTELELIQTAEYPMGLALRTVDGEKQLVVGDHGGGIRIYGE